MIADSLHVLAFGFASPVLLGWLALAAVPVLIHWLFRRRYREVTWAAMQFLHEAARKQSRRTRLEQLLLLAARVLILALIVFAFARPRWIDAGKLVRATPPTLRVIVLDVSLSMGRKAAHDDANTAATPRGSDVLEPRPSGSGQESVKNPLPDGRGSKNSQTLMEVGKSIARDVVSKSRSGDRFTLVRLGGSEPRVLIRQPTLMASGVLDEIDRLSQSFERGDVAATLRQLPELIVAKQPNEQCEVVVISDFQADNWHEAESVLSPLADRATLVMIDVGSALPDNAAVVGLTTDPPILAGEQPMSVSATLRNAGAVPIVARKVELRIDDQLADSRRVDLPLGQDAAVEFTLTAPASGEHTLSIKLEEDSLLADNERWLPLSVRSELSVLLVNGRASGRARDAATFFVEQALAPKTTDRAANSRWLRVTTVPDSELPNLELDRHDVVFVCDVGTLTELDVERLRRFAENGGGVIVSLGPSVLVEKLNEVAFSLPGLMTLHLDDVVTSTTDGGQPSVFGFDPGDFTHPLLREFRGNPGAGLETALIRQYVRAGIVPAQRPMRFGVAEIALRFSTGDAAIVTQSLGRGRCVLVTTSLDETWGEWSIWAAGFVPLMHELTQYAAAGRSQPREGLIGELILRELPNDSATATLTLPDGNTRMLSPVPHADSPRIVVSETNQPGNYTLTLPTNITERFAINVDPRESDPRRLDPRDWAAHDNQPNGIIVRDVAAPTPSLADIQPDANSLSLGLLVAVLGLLLVEQALAWRFTAGVGLAMLLLLLTLLWFLFDTLSR